ncbi:MazG nucleotide pyrophosphohydrolase domain-containing protein [Deinococcus yavapaiensis]|uniref:MazG-like nucleotide pyrophosphohydrolase family protein n=1 Tax=Deinococcus yavapaiensis KR-236 TaxID=694435 RepID=A0A318S0P9_9DEIO|nr:MazG nucleotide pyrophosphohydrolase domain-containing protein [Deinococcus yavapaiensis]PYE50466.1 MazG-like nucleotide pyrophosphohydrolase family protein [Deinococcus yavapaiensis KR-236]
MPSDPQRHIYDFVRSHGLVADPTARLLDLASEVGEVAKELLKATHYGVAPFTPSAAWAEELGDVYFSLLCLADATDVDLDEALDRVLAKYAHRLAERGDASSGR